MDRAEDLREQIAPSNNSDKDSVDEHELLPRALSSGLQPHKVNARGEDSALEHLDMRSGAQDFLAIERSDAAPGEIEDLQSHRSAARDCEREARRIAHRIGRGRMERE